MDGMNGAILKRAYLYKIPIRISHSHNTEHLTTNKVKRIYHEHTRKMIPKYATDMWACSENAGRWLYGEHCPFEIIPNAIDVERYKFDEEKRRKLRLQYALEGKYVIGHVGRFDYQKNQEFLVSVFARITAQKDNAVLILVGDGKEKEVIEKKVQDLSLQDKVLFLGNRRNVEELLNMFDIFVLPSRFEGLGIAAIEAQANGLPCICSTMVPAEVNITQNVSFLSLDDTTSWITSMQNIGMRDRKALEKICSAGYDIREAATKLQEKYLALRERL